MPRRCSSGRRSASIPVRARRSVVLPWSMWPAVPTTTVIPRLRARARGRAAAEQRRVATPDRPFEGRGRRGRARCGRSTAGSPARRRARRSVAALPFGAPRARPTDGERLAGHRAPADGRLEVDDLRRPARGAPRRALGPRPEHPRARVPSIRQTGISPRRPAGAVEGQRRRDRGERSSCRAAWPGPVGRAGASR